MSPAETLILEAVRAGVLLHVDGDRLRFKALRSMPADLAERLKVHKADVLAALRPAEADPAPEAPEDPQPAPPTYSPQERGILRDAGIRPGDLPLLDAAKQTFPEAVVVAAQDPTAPPRILAGRLIRRARRLGGRDEAVAMRDAWQERVAIATVDGGLPEHAAEAVALEEIQAAAAQRASVL